jgi:hypothetical protein
VPKKLSKLTTGDIFHAHSANAPSLICLVTSTTATTIHARTVTTQLVLEFDRSTGVGKPTDDLLESHIDSITPLPVDIYNVMLGIDRKFRLETDVERFRLTDAEKRALIYVDSHYESHPL